MNAISEPMNQKIVHFKRRTLSRLAAIQALYQMSFDQMRGDKVIGQFLQKGRLEEDFIPTAEAINIDLFSKLVLGVEATQESIDHIIIKSLPDEWPFKRLDPVIVMLLRCGVYELLNFPDIATPIIISEYLDIAHAFYDGKEIGFINGILDALVKVIRE